MEQRKQVVDKVSIMRSNGRGNNAIKDTLERAQKITYDGDKKERVEACLCKACYYIFNHRMGGAAMTNRPCGICDTKMQFASTATDVICKGCAQENDLCKQCGGDMCLKDRRSPKPFMVK